MKVRHTNKPHVTGFSGQFNIHGLSEVIVGYDEGDMDSVSTRDLDVFIEKTQQWKSMRDAFHDRDLIVDNYNTYFFEPHTEEDRARGFTL